MLSDDIKIRYIGGPTALLEVGGIKFVTDPTFDEGNTDYKTNVYVLHKLSGPAIRPENLGGVDFVLLSHDHHFDNLDNSGRKFLSSVKKVFTTVEGSKRLGGNSIGLNVWEYTEIMLNDKRTLTITAVPCRHGPAGIDRGPVTGFVLNYKDSASGAVYISGDTVWYEGVEQVSKKFDVRLMLLFMGAAKVKEVGPYHLTFTAEEGVLAAKSFPDARIIPLHFEGWRHFSESKEVIEKVFKKAGLLHRLEWIN